MSELTTELRRPPETTAKGIWPCCASMMLEDLGDRLELWEQFEVEILLVLGEGFDGHVEAVHLVEVGNDFDGGLAAPGVEELFIKDAAPLAERLLPGDVVEGHGVGDGAVAVEEIGAEWAWGQVQFHADGCSSMMVRWTRRDCWSVACCELGIARIRALRFGGLGAQPPSPGLVGSIWRALLKRLK